MADYISQVPTDILLIIGQYLDVASYVGLTSTCRALHSPSMALDPLYWRAAVRKTFRVPNQPAAQSDGARWRALYIRLHTQTRPFTWGNNMKGNLGHGHWPLDYESFSVWPTQEQILRARRSQTASWPEEVQGYDGAEGVVADLQAGGWSTSFLTSKGKLYATGVIDGQDNFHNPARMQPPVLRPQALTFPPTFESRRAGDKTIDQFSAGRAHILGLSDTGMIWSWSDIKRPGLSVKLMDIDLTERGNAGGRSKVVKVVAGWNKSAALIRGRGIVVWEPLHHEDHHVSGSDTVFVLERALVPMTGFQRRSRYAVERSRRSETEEGIGQVLVFIVLEKYIVFCTDTGRVYASLISMENGSDHINASNLIEILVPHHTDRPDSGFVTDVQGSFRQFALFTKTGTVLNASQEHIDAYMGSGARNRQEFPFVRIPALQKTGVIAMAFGDHHFLALHSAGHITAYGTESQACGSLGLGGTGKAERRFRGFRYAGLSMDGKLVPHAYTTGRRVWFEPEKREWITFLVSGGCDPREAIERIRMCQHPNVHAEVSEWIEQEGNAWAERFSRSADESGESDAVPAKSADDAVAPYFALSVTAAGWHSGALVLVDEAAAARIRNNAIIHRPLPAMAEGDGAARPTPTTNNTPFQALIWEPLSWAVTSIVWLLRFTSRTVAEASPNHRQTGDGTPPAPQPGAAPVPPATGAGIPAAAAAPTPARPPAYPPQQQQQQQGTDRPRRPFDDPVEHGAAPDEHSHWAWAHDHFPRLQLSDGSVMPGQVEVSRWRKGRPDWDLSFTVYS